jgi:Anticodon binding domain
MQWRLRVCYPSSLMPCAVSASLRARRALSTSATRYELVRALRGARGLDEARDHARQILEPEPVRLADEARPTLQRFKELADGDARETVRELKAAGGDLRALRLALTGREHGPELCAVVHALPRDEALRRVDAAL